MNIRHFVAISLMVVTTTNSANQVPDLDFKPALFDCTYCQSVHAPRVAVDSAHFNFHTLENRFSPFKKVLEADGFKVTSHHSSFSSESLKRFDIVVIANALHEKNHENWDLPIHSAFTRQEIEAIYQWVNSGGSLFLIADHLPWPAASSELAAVFGFGFFNGYVEVTGHQEQFFSREDNGLLISPVTPKTGKNKVERVQSFLGQGFTIPMDASPVLQFVHPSVSWMPGKSWHIDDNTPCFDATFLYQGAVKKVGDGKIAVFGEAGMFTAQVVNEGNETWKMGMNAESASQNQQLLLNIVRWLGEKK